MAYFQRQENSEENYTHQFAPARQEEYEEEWEDDTEYDDGFDELDLPDEEAPEEELSDEELRQEKQRKYRIAAGFGDFGATIVGVLVILVLVAFLISMSRFVSSDFSQNFSLWSTRF